MRRTPGCPTLVARLWRQGGKAQLPGCPTLVARLWRQGGRAQTPGAPLLSPVFGDRVGGHEPNPAALYQCTIFGCPTSARFWQMWESTNPTRLLCIGHNPRVPHPCRPPLATGWESTNPGCPTLVARLWRQGGRAQTRVPHPCRPPLATGWETTLFTVLPPRLDIPGPIVHAEITRHSAASGQGPARSADSRPTETVIPRGVLEILPLFLCNPDRSSPHPALSGPVHTFQ